MVAAPREQLGQRFQWPQLQGVGFVGGVVGGMMVPQNNLALGSVSLSGVNTGSPLVGGINTGSIGDGENINKVQEAKEKVGTSKVEKSNVQKPKVGATSITIPLKRVGSLNKGKSGEAGVESGQRQLRDFI
jgi:hypothetical protein